MRRAAVPVSDAPLGLVVGDVVAAHRAGVELARRVFTTPVPSGWDVGVFNAYPKDNEFVQTGMAFNIWHSAPAPIVHERGTIVLCTAASEGFGFHALHGPNMRLPGTSSMSHSYAPREMILFSPDINRRDLNAATREALTLCRTWEEVVAALRDKHGSGTRAAIFPCGATQLAEKP